MRTASDRLYNNFSTIFSQDNTAQPAEPWQQRRLWARLPARGMMLIPAHQQNPCTGPAHISARSTCQLPASLQGWWLGRHCAPTLLRLQFALIPNKWRLWKVSLISAHHKRTCTTQAEKYLNIHFPQYHFFLLVPLHLFIAWEKKKKKKNQDL